MKTRLFFFIAMMTIGIVSSAQAQDKVEGHIKADIVSNYIWRGLNIGHVSVQPEMSVGWKGLSLAAWGSVGLSGHKDDVREIDMTLSYETGNLQLGIIDSFELPLFGQVTANPASQHFYFVFGLTLKAL